MNERISQISFRHKQRGSKTRIEYVDAKKAFLPPIETFKSNYKNHRPDEVEKFYKDIETKGVGVFMISSNRLVHDVVANEIVSITVFKSLIGISETHPAFNLSNLLHKIRLLEDEGFPDTTLLGNIVVRQLYKEAAQ